MKIITERWGGVDITLIDVQVQGEPAVAQIVGAIEQFNHMAEPPEVLVITRGGGSADDLQAFSTEQVTRAVAASRVLTLVAIGHEVDISLAELAADKRASTPSNAAELLVPDRRAALEQLQHRRDRLSASVSQLLQGARQELRAHQDVLHRATNQVLAQARQRLVLQQRLLHAYDPQAALKRGYALVRLGDTVVRSGRDLAVQDVVDVQMAYAHITERVDRINQET